MDTENEKRDENPKIDPRLANLRKIDPRLANLRKIDPRLANLRPPFSSENQPEHNGRPKGAISLVSLMRKLAAAEAHEEREKIREIYGEEVAEKITNGHIYIARVHQAAIKGEEWAIKIWLSYLDGMPRQAIDLGGQKDNPFKQNVYNIINPEQKVTIEKGHAQIDEL